LFTVAVVDHVFQTKSTKSNVNVPFHVNVFVKLQLLFVTVHVSDKCKVAITLVFVAHVVVYDIVHVGEIVSLILIILDKIFQVFQALSIFLYSKV
jgi:hypothetical protein